jgi:hypothetical protein
MRTLKPLLLTILLCLAPACSPRDFLTRRLATDLISATAAFRAPQVFWLKTGIVSNKDFNSPDSLVLQRHGWIIGSQQKCPAGVDPPPCWDVILSPHGVDFSLADFGIDTRRHTDADSRRSTGNCGYYRCQQSRQL